MEAFKFTKVKPGDILVLDYDLVPGDNALANIDEAILSEGLTGTWLEPYKKFKVATVSKSCNITLKANVLDFSKLTLGYTFNFGKYQVESETPWAIEWEIVHQTDTYQIAQTKQIIDLRCFDAKEPNNTDSNRKNYGNNNWQYSNIKQFLNSDQESWYSAQHSYDVPPNSSNTSANPYDTHKGFLYYFSDEEKNLLKDMTITLANPNVDGGGSYTWTGKVWLPTYTQMTGNQNNSISEGTKFDKYTDDDSRIKTIHSNCKLYNPYAKSSSSVTSDGAWYYWMSSADPSGSYRSRRVVSGGDLEGNGRAYSGDGGLAPCICLPRKLGGGVINDTISFYIDDTLYKSPKGYTFSQWVNTSYNYNGWYNNSNKSDRIDNYNTNTYISGITGSNTIEDGKKYTTTYIMINFTINGESLDCRINSTWSDWVTNGGTMTPSINWSVSDAGYIISTDTNCHINDVIATDKIIEGNNYWYSNGSKLTTDFSTMSLGSTFNFGKYQVESENPWAIVWEIVHQTDEYQIAQTKQIIDCRAFDAKEPNNTDSDRKNYGNNNWQYSNIKQFLNSDQATWYSAQHSYDAPPDTSANTGGYNTQYQSHKGFLYYFSDEEKNLLKDMTFDLFSYDTKSSYTWTGKVWLPTYTQMSGNLNNSIAEGTKFDKYNSNSDRIKTIHPNCKLYNPYAKSSSNITSNGAWYYWMSSASPSYSSYSRNVGSGGFPESNNDAYNGSTGLAPCICLPKTGGIWS